MKPLDPRLLRYARATRGFLLVAVVVGGLTAAPELAAVDVGHAVVFRQTLIQE